MALSEAEKAYLAANPDVARDPYFSKNPAAHYERHGQYEGRGFGGGGGASYHEPFHGGFHGGGFHGMHSPPDTFDMAGFMAQQEAQMAEAQRLAAEQAEQQRLAQGRASRDAAYSAYLDAGSLATDFIANEIAQEQANANLLGIDYAITDEERAGRVSDYFATVWGEGDQRNLEQLIGEFGDPKGFGGYTFVRGEGGRYAQGTEGEERPVASARGIRPTLATDDEPGLGGAGNVLGV